MKKLFILGATSLVLGFAPVVYGQTGTGSYAPPPMPPKEILDERRGIIKDSVGEIKDINRQRKTDIRNVVGEAKNEGTFGSTTKIQIREINQEARNQMEAERMERREALKENRIDFKNALIEKRKNQISEYTERMMKRMNAAIERLEDISDRIASRILKIEEAGGNADQSQTHLDNAEMLIGEASESVLAIGDALNNALTASTTEEAKKTINEAVANAREDIKAAHKELIEAIRNLKGVSTTVPTATTTNN